MVDTSHPQGFSKLFLCRIDTSGECFFDDIVKVAVRGPLRSKMISQALTENVTKSCDVSDVMGSESAPVLRLDLV
jgi:hypothetical protein